MRSDYSTKALTAEHIILMVISAVTFAYFTLGVPGVLFTSMSSISSAISRNVALFLRNFRMYGFSSPGLVLTMRDFCDCALSNCSFWRARFDADREQTIQERLEASRMILKRYSLDEERACSLTTWSHICTAIK